MKTEELLMIAGAGVLGWLLFLKPKQQSPEDQLWQNVGNTIGNLFGGGSTSNAFGRSSGVSYAPPPAASYPDVFPLNNPMSLSTAAAVNPITSTPGLAITSDNPMLAINYRATSTGQPAMDPSVPIMVPGSTRTGIPATAIQDVDGWNGGGPVYNGDSPPLYNPPLPVVDRRRFDDYIQRPFEWFDHDGDLRVARSALSGEIVAIYDVYPRD